MVGKNFVVVFNYFDVSFLLFGIVFVGIVFVAPGVGDIVVFFFYFKFSEHVGMSEDKEFFIGEFFGEFFKVVFDELFIVDKIESKVNEMVNKFTKRDSIGWVVEFNDRIDHDFLKHRHTNGLF